MPNTKSAERRMRSSVRKERKNRIVKSRLKTLESKYLEIAKSGQKDTVDAAYRQAVSALDKAAGAGVIHPGRSDRKKSRLAKHLIRPQ